MEQKGKAGFEVLREDAAIIEVTPIEDDRYESEGPTEVLEPAD